MGRLVAEDFIGVVNYLKSKARVGIRPSAYRTGIFFALLLRTWRRRHALNDSPTVSLF